MTRISIALACFCLASVSFAQTRHFSADDLPKIVRISDPQISPDGKTIAVVVARANLKEDRYDPEIELIDIATKQMKTMTHDRLGIGSVRWSPNGDRVAYLAQDDGKKAQIYILPVGGGDSQQLTHSKTSISVLAWRPDGTGLAYAAADEEPEKKGEAKFEDEFEVGNNDYLERSRPEPIHLWTVACGDEAAKQVTFGAESLPVSFPPAGAPAQIWFTPGGGSLVFVRAESPISGDNDTSRLEVLDLKTGAMRRITPADLEERNPLLSPDGSQVAYGYDKGGKRPNEESVYVAPVSGGVGTDALPGFDHNVGGAAWMPDGKALLVAANDGTRAGLWLQTLGGAAKPVSVGALNPGGFNVGKDGAVAFTASDATHPAELFYMARVGDGPVQMTHLQTVTDGLQLGRQETLKWKSDGFEVQGVLTYPPDYLTGKRYPLVLYLHGGPTGTSVETFTTPAQIFAAQGWLVFEPNYRGSDNEGNAFETAIVKDAGAGPGRDVMTGVAAVEKLGIVDETRVAVGGWSYGGYMTSWLIGNYPATWKVAVAGAPVTDLVDQYTLSDNNTQRAAGYGPSPFVGDNLRSYQVQSPISYAWRVKVPTLILSDVGDWRVTTTQAYKLYHALKDNHVPVKFLAFPVPGHSPADPIRAREVWRHWTAWFAQYLNETPVAAKP